ncbi:aldo/keto reductase [Bacillus daqingensis]|uniref:Aldo/keto reductase n=1 Tax=Bacillus daqingensis TaxID=872396 RepID=A0ABV9NZU8_9BACI
MNHENRKLGKEGPMLSPIGIGCWQFSRGANAVGRYWDDVESEDMQAIVRSSLAGGINWFDTAEVYGNGASERALADALDQEETGLDEVYIADKWWPGGRTSRSIEKTIAARRDALNQRPIALYQIHQPFSFSSVRKEMEAMLALKRRGEIGEIGVSNFTEKRMLEAYKTLHAEGVPLASNQIKYSLLDRKAEINGLFDTCRELGISIIAYSPLEQGLLTGKYHQDPEAIKKKRGPRKWMGRFRRGYLEKTGPLMKLLEETAAKYEATVSQVVLSWMIQYHGDLVFAIPGASSEKHAIEHAGALSVRLTDDEAEQISNASWDVQL